MRLHRRPCKIDYILPEIRPFAYGIGLDQVNCCSKFNMFKEYSG